MPDAPVPHVLVPLDGSRVAENAIPYAWILARSLDCGIRFLQVASGDERRGDVEYASQIFEDYARSRAIHFGLPAARTTAALLFGDPSSTILEAATPPATRAIALATHGRGGFRATVFGSVADRVIRGAEVPVLVVPGVGGPPTEMVRILVTLDGSPTAERALGPARAIARAVGAEVVLLRAYTVVPPPAVGYVYYPPEVPRAIVAEANEYIDRNLQEGERGFALQGDPVSTISGLANSLDVSLIVMSRTGKRLAARLAMGSTTEQVLHTAHRPVLVVPPSARAS